MALYGFNDLKQFALPTGVDAGTLAKYALVDGTDFNSLVEDIGAALDLKNRTILSDPRFGGMLSVTTSQMLEYRNGVGNAVEEHTENATGTTQRGATVGHMLPIKTWDRKLGWTADFLRKARQVQLDADVSDAMSDMGENFERRILTRFYTSTDNAVGSTGYDVAFANANATALDFAPPKRDGQSFASSHTHFARYTADAAGRKAALDAGVEHLFEHGIEPPYFGTIPGADVTAWTGVTGIVFGSYGVDFLRTDYLYGVMPLENPFIFAYQSPRGMVYLWATYHLPTNYFGLYKSYGFNDMRNSLKLRYSPDYGVGMILKASDIHNYPLHGAIIQHEFGVGVGDGRLNGFAAYFAASGNYVNPTIT